MVWDKPKIIHALMKLHKQGAELSYNVLAKKEQALVSAAAYHFGSFRRAVEQAGINYAEVVRRPRWTRTAIIKLIKDARRGDEELHWSAVIRRRDELGKAAFASLQPRLFGSWDRALHAAGLHADDVNRYRKWNKNTVVADLKSRQRDGELLNSGAIQKDDPGLHAAAVRYFAGYDQALLAAKINPEKVRQRKVWAKADVIKALKQAKENGKPLSDPALRRLQPALYTAAVRIFGTLPAARAAAAGMKRV